MPVVPVVPLVMRRYTHKSRLGLDEDHHPSRSEEDREALHQSSIVGYLEQHGSNVYDV